MNLWSNKKAVCNCGWRKKPKKKKKTKRTEPECNSTTSCILKYPATVFFFYFLFLSSPVSSIGSLHSNARPDFQGQVLTPVSSWGWAGNTALYTVFRQHALYICRASLQDPFFFFTWHCILQKTVNTVRHRKQVDNNESDCGKSVCTQD